MSAKLHAAQPQNDSSKITLTLYGPAVCGYEVTISTSFLEILGQVLRFHGTSLPVYTMSNLLLGYGAQLSSLLSKGNCVELDSALDSAVKPYKVEIILNICTFLVRYSWFRNVWQGLMLPQMDAVQLYSLDLWLPIISLLLFMFGKGIAYWSGICLVFALRIFSSLWINFKRPTTFTTDSRLRPHRLLTEALFFAFICWRMCGAFSLLLVFLHYLLKV
ncbi:GPI inositol-deacylase [Rhinophrynus dorsalis]